MSKAVRKPIVYAVPNDGCWPNFTAGKRHKVVCENGLGEMQVVDNDGNCMWSKWKNSNMGHGDWKRIEVPVARKKSKHEKLLEVLLSCFVFERDDLGFRGQLFNKLPKKSLQELIKIRKKMK